MRISSSASMMILRIPCLRLTVCNLTNSQQLAIVIVLRVPLTMISFKPYNAFLHPVLRARTALFTQFEVTTEGSNSAETLLALKEPVQMALWCYSGAKLVVTASVVRSLTNCQSQVTGHDDFSLNIHGCQIGLVCGWSHESEVFGVLLPYMAYWLTHYDTRCSRCRCAQR